MVGCGRGAHFFWRGNRGQAVSEIVSRRTEAISRRIDVPAATVAFMNDGEEPGRVLPGPCSQRGGAALDSFRCRSRSSTMTLVQPVGGRLRPSTGGVGNALHGATACLDGPRVFHAAGRMHRPSGAVRASEKCSSIKAGFVRAGLG